MIEVFSQTSKSNYLLSFLVTFQLYRVIYCDFTVRSERRAVISLTTSPKRLSTIEPTLNSLLHQTSAADIIQLNLPRVFMRSNDTFPVDIFERYPILTDPRIRVAWHNDLGPITKLVPTLITERNPETLIIIVDDDTIYPSHMVALMRERIEYDPNYVQTGHCGDTLLTNKEEEYYVPPFNLTKLSGKGGGCCCRLHEGFGGVGYRRGIFDDPNLPFQRYLDIALSNKECFRSDDFVVSNYLTLNGYQGLDLQLKARQQRQGYESDALHKLEPTGHPYSRCSQFLQLNNLSFIRTRNDQLPSS